MSDALTRPVAINKSSRPFGELTLDEVRARAQELSADVGWGPTAKVAPVARAWTDLADHMAATGAATVADDGEYAESVAQALWIIPPGGSLL